MNILLWVLQGLLAIHTAIGAVWKLSNTEEAVPSLTAISRPGWRVLSVVELLLAAALILAGFVAVPYLAAGAAALIALEMLVFCALHLSSGSKEKGLMSYWLVAAAFAGFVAVGRAVIVPL